MKKSFYSSFFFSIRSIFKLKKVTQDSPLKLIKKLILCCFRPLKTLSPTSETTTSEVATSGNPTFQIPNYLQSQLDPALLHNGYLFDQVSI
jgi:hypothetical protein